MRIYTDIQDVLCSPVNPAHGVVSLRVGKAAATLTAGAHPATEHLRSLGLSLRGIAAMFSADYKSHTGDFDVLGPASRKVPDYAGSDATQASLVVSPAPGIGYEVEQFPYQMPFGYTPDLALGPDFWARVQPPTTGSVWSCCSPTPARYRDVPLGTADASVVAAAERLNHRQIATLDRRHRGVVQSRLGALTLLP